MKQEKESIYNSKTKTGSQRKRDGIEFHYSMLELLKAFVAPEFSNNAG